MKRIMTLIAILMLLFVVVGCEEKTGTAGAGENQAAAHDADDESGASDSGESFTGSLKELMTKSVPMKCTWNVATEGMTATGTVYVAGQKYRSEMSFSEGGTQGTQYGISDGEYMYVWGSDRPQGTKLKISALEAQQEQADTPSEGEAQYKDMETSYNYRCTPWIASADKFRPPTNIEFLDYTAMMQQAQQMQQNMQNGQTPTQADMCAMCSTIPDAASRADCLESCSEQE